MPRRNGRIPIGGGISRRKESIRCAMVDDSVVTLRSGQIFILIKARDSGAKVIPYTEYLAAELAGTTRCTRCRIMPTDGKSAEVFVLPWRRTFRFPIESSADGREGQQ